MRFAFIILLTLSSIRLSATGLVREPYQGVRPTGMGNAFLALSDDNNALWYNPAGLARVKNYHVSIIDMTVGVDNLDALGRLGSALFAGNYNGLIRTDRQWFRMGLR